MKKNFAKRLVATLMLVCMVLSLPVFAVDRYRLKVAISEENAPNYELTDYSGYLSLNESLTAEIAMVVGANFTEENRQGGNGLYGFESKALHQLVKDGLEARQGGEAAWDVWVDSYYDEVANANEAASNLDLKAKLRDLDTKVSELAPNVAYTIEYALDVVEADDPAYGNTYTVTITLEGGSSSEPSEPEDPYYPPSTPSVSGGTTTQVDDDGNVGKTTVNTDGTVTAQVDMEKAAAQAAARNNETIKLPISQLTASSDADKAPVVTINTGIEEEVSVEIPVKGVTSYTVVALIGEDGSLIIIRDSVVTKNGVVVSVANGQKLVVISVKDPFTDVPADHWGRDAVSFCYSRKLFAGVSETEFAPESPITRAMVAQVLYNLVSNPSVNVEKLFDDVAAGKWFTNAIIWAAQNKVVSGYGDGTFGTEKNITREELVTMLWNYAGTPAGNSAKLAEFVDGKDVASWAKNAMSWAVENGVVAGKGGKVIDPQGNATRVEAAQMMKNFLESMVK